MSDPPSFECSICHRICVGWSNNAHPVNDGRCCTSCDWSVVIPARVRMIARAERLASKLNRSTTDET